MVSVMIVLVTMAISHYGTNLRTPEVGSIVERREIEVKNILLNHCRFLSLSNGTETFP